MSKDIESLIALPQRFTVAGKGFRIKPHCPLIIGTINKHFRTKDNPNGYQVALDKIFQDADYEVAAEFIYLCLEKCPPEVDSIDKFKKLLLEDNKDISLITELVALCLSDAGQDFTFKEETSKKKLMMSLVLLSLAIVGMMHTLFWLYGLIYPFLSSLI